MPGTSSSVQLKDKGGNDEMIIDNSRMTNLNQEEVGRSMANIPPQN